MAKLKQDIVQNLESYRDLFDSAHDLIHVVEKDGTVIYVNNAWKKVLGYPEEEIRGQSIYSFIHQTDRDRFFEYRNSIMAGANHESDIVIGMMAKNGSIVYAEGFVSCKMVNGEVLYTRGIFKDITNRIHNEAELKSLLVRLKERESNLEQLLFHAPDAIIVINSESIIRYWNPKAEQVFGWTSPEALGKRLTEVVIPPQYRKAHEEGMKRYMTTGEHQVLNRTIEITALSKDNREFFVALTISATFQNGETSFIAFVRDIDAQKRDERELEEKRMQLEFSNQQLEQFAHVASHDMKEPIRKILMFTERIQQDTDNILSLTSANYINRVQNAAKRLTEMVDGVLTHSSVKTEKFIAEKIELADILKKIESDLELIFLQKKAVVRYSDLPIIEGTPFLIYQLFYNLFSNSLKFSRKDVPPVIEVTAANVSASEAAEYGIKGMMPYTKIIVKDNGIGFNQEHAESIFNSFTRLNPKDQYEGTGLGLSLCKTIVEKHNGVIKAFSKENSGATFVILLPEFQKPGSF